MSFNYSERERERYNITHNIQNDFEINFWFRFESNRL